MIYFQYLILIKYREMSFLESFQFLCMVIYTTKCLFLLGLILYIKTHQENWLEKVLVDHIFFETKLWSNQN